MKITQAFYDVPAGQVVITRHELTITVKLNGRTILGTVAGLPLTERTGADEFAPYVEKMNERPGTIAEVAAFHAELCRFA